KDSKNSFGKEESSKKNEKERKTTSKKAARLITWKESSSKKNEKERKFRRETEKTEEPQKTGRHLDQERLDRHRNRDHERHQDYGGECRVILMGCVHGAGHGSWFSGYGSQKSRFREYRLKRVSAISVFGTAGLVVRSTRVFSWKVLIIAVLRQGKDECFAGTARITCWRSYLEPQLCHTITSFEKKAYSTFILCLGDRVLREITKEMTAAGDLAATDSAISDEDQTLLLLTSLPSSYDNFMDTLLYGQDTLKLEDGRSSRLGCYICQSEEHLKRIVPGIITRNLKVMSGLKIMYPVLELIEGSYHITYRKDYLVDLKSMTVVIYYLVVMARNAVYEGRSGKIKVIKGSLVVVSGTRRANCIYTLDGQAVTKKTLKGRKQLGEYQTMWKIKMGNVLDSCNQRSTQQYTKSGIAKDLGLAGIKQQNGLVKEINVTLLAKVRCFLIQSILSKVFWAEGTTMSTYLVNRSPSSAIGFKKPVDMEQHSAWELFGYKEDSNEAAFVVAAVEKIYAHESLTFNNTVACEEVSTKFVGGTLHTVVGGSLSRDYDVEKNGKWSCIYAVGSHEYQMVCTRRDIASADVGMLDGFDRGLETYVQVFLDFDYAMAAYMTLTEAAKDAIWLKGLPIELGFELKIVTGIATGALLKAIPSSRFQHELMLLLIKDF
nr:zinc finger, CCHC-type [Tanacetum cinerariifolium]